MYRIDNSTASTTLPTQKPAGTPGFFTAGTVGGQPATIVEADWLNTVQEEICAVLNAAAMSPNKSDRTQLIEAILSLIRNSTRRRLTAPLDLYVSTTGSDTNDGLTASTPWATLQHAYNSIMNNIDMGGQPITVHLTPGTYAPLEALCAPVGCTYGAYINILGDKAAPQNYVISGNNAHAIGTGWGAILLLTGLRLQAGGTLPGVSPCAITVDQSYITVDGCDFGTCTQYHVGVFGPGTYVAVTPYSISGGARCHVAAGASGSQLNINGAHVSIFNTPNFSIAFAIASANATLMAGGCVFTGSTTGKRADVNLNAVIECGGNPDALFPGTIPSTSSTGGMYA